MFICIDIYTIIYMNSISCTYDICYIYIYVYYMVYMCVSFVHIVLQGL